MKLAILSIIICLFGCVYAAGSGPDKNRANEFSMIAYRYSNCTKRIFSVDTEEEVCTRISNLDKWVFFEGRTSSNPFDDKKRDDEEDDEQEWVEVLLFNENTCRENNDIDEELEGGFFEEGLCSPCDGCFQDGVVHYVRVFFNDDIENSGSAISMSIATIFASVIAVALAF